MKSGDTIVFTDHFKKYIDEKCDAENVLYYVKNDEFVVKDTKPGFIKIVGIAMWGWMNMDLFKVIIKK